MAEGKAEDKKKEDKRGCNSNGVTTVKAKDEKRMADMIDDK